MLRVNLLSLEDFFERINHIGVVSFNNNVVFSNAFGLYYAYIEEVEQTNKQLFEHIHYGEYHIVSLLSQALIGDESERLKRIYAFKYLIIPESLIDQIICQLICMAQQDSSILIKKGAIHVLAYIGFSIKYHVFNFLVTQGYNNLVAQQEGTADQAKAALHILTYRAAPCSEDERLIDTLIALLYHIERDVRLATIRALSHWDLINQENGKVFKALYQLVTDDTQETEIQEAAQHALELFGGRLLLRMVMDPAFRNAIIAPSQTSIPSQSHSSGLLFSNEAFSSAVAERAPSPSRSRRPSP